MSNEMNKDDNKQSTGSVETLTPHEAENFAGITIEEEDNYRKEANYQHSQYYEESRFRYNPRGRKINGFTVFNITAMPWWKKALWTVGIGAVIAFFIFVALPVLLTVIGAGLVAWVIFRLLRVH